MHPWESFISGLRQWSPPDHTLSYLWSVRTPLFETLEIAAAAMLIAISLGLLLGLYIGARLPGARALYVLLTSFRAIPDLTLALLCVIAIGLGPAAGVVALAMFYSAAIGKIFADLFASAERAPVEALESTGANRIMVALYGLLPLRRQDLLTSGAYEFESAIRASVVVGFVGAGGIGTELVGYLNQTDYHHATPLILLLVLLIALVDGLCWLVRRHPRLVLPLIVLGAAAAFANRPQTLYFRHAIKTFAAMWPPRLAPNELASLPKLLGETLEMAFGGTLLAIVCALPLGVAAARNISPAFVSFPVRRLLEGLRAIPEMVWGLILLGFAVWGPSMGILALGLHSAGALGKLYAESLENVNPEPILALAATGASRIAITSFGLLPLAFGPVAVQSLFRLEWNMRAATIVGMIGAGGIGGALFYAQQQSFYHPMIAYIIITWALIMIVDRISGRLRSRWGIVEIDK
ncbi:MAG TPA: ABC transporter permease subunit [Candidatus Angelobacter sp.]|jgi:phosphonate transport system permease protein|nr:ABC transporter permease subunit [Candidatus Angelobacter sp.]